MAGYGSAGPNMASSHILQDPGLNQLARNAFSLSGGLYILPAHVPLRPPKNVGQAVAAVVEKQTTLPL